MKIYRHTKLLFFAIGSILILIFNEFFVYNLKYFIGPLMVLYGIIGIIDIVLEKEVVFYNHYDFVFNVIEILIGLIVLLLVKEYSTVCIIWAMWSIFRETIEIREVISYKFHNLFRVIVILESAVVICLSVMLIMHPGYDEAKIHAYLLCVELILTGSIPVMNDFVLNKTNKK